MALAKKLAKVLSAVFLLCCAASCDNGCVEAQEFDQEVVTIESYPVKDGVSGLGDAQLAQWHDTGLKTNGEAVSLQITGGWTPWYGNDDISGVAQLRALDACKFCALSDSSPNCICYSGQTPSNEEYYTGNDCATNIVAQNDPTKCTCTRQYGAATDYGVRHFSLNKYDKSHTELLPDKQDPCKYTGGMGLYLGVFGTSGNVTPIRAYHLFSETAVCDVNRNADGKCLDENGNDVTKYIFNSANSRTFVKDDNNGNSGADINLDRDTLHSRNEEIKLIIYDTRYDDNYGSYQVSFLSGIGTDEDTGLLEYLVSLIEDEVMGTPDDNGVRQGGIIKTMFSEIAVDSGFVSLVQIGLSFYIITYGMSVLIGLAEVNKKEVMTRMLKIALVMFFTSPTSWYWYDKLVIGLFKDSMDYVISIFMSFSDQNLDPTSGIVTAQMDRASSNSNATRFSYADLIIRNMLSVATAKKVFGLFFGVTLFGPLYILAIYALVAGFLYVMLFVAMNYVVSIVKLAFGLSLGPIFIAFTLSGYTNSMFKQWLSFVGARSLEIIIIFLVLYNFLVLIDQSFTSLLYYKACVTQWNLWLFSIPIIKSEVSRSLISWCSSFIMLGGLIFITKLIMDKIPDLAGSLISIGGQKDSTFGGGASAASGMAGGLAGMAQSVAAAGMNMAGDIAAKSYQGASSAMAGTGSRIADGVSGVIRSLPGGNAAMDTAMKAINAMPSNPRAMYRNSIIDSAISAAQKNAASKGLTGEKADAAIRAEVTNKLLSGDVKGTSIGGSLKTSAAIGLNLDTIAKRMDEQLVNKPLAEFIKSEAQKLKAGDNPLIGRALRDQLQENINKWADKNLSGGSAAVKDIMNDKNAVVNGIRSGGMGLDNMKSLLRKSSEYSADEAAKAFANNPNKQAEYLQHLKDNQFQAENHRQKVTDAAFSKTFNKFSNNVRDAVGSVAKTIKPFDNAFGNDALTDPARAAQSFMRKAQNLETRDAGNLSQVMRAKTGSWLAHGQGSYLNPFNVLGRKNAIREQIKEGNRSGLLNYLSKNGARNEQAKIREEYAKKKKDAPNGMARAALDKKMKEKLENSAKRREFFKNDLRDIAVKMATKDSKSVADDVKKLSNLERGLLDNTRKMLENSGAKYMTEKMNSAKKLAKDLMDNTSKMKSLKDRLDKNEEENMLNPDEERSKKIAQDRELLASLQEKNAKQQEEKKELEKEMEKSSKEFKEAAEKLKKERGEDVAEILKLKLEIKGLDEVVKDIQHLERSQNSTQDNISAKLAGEDPTTRLEADNLRGEMERKALQKQLEKEYEDALQANVKIQRELFAKVVNNLGEDDSEQRDFKQEMAKELSELDNLKGKDLQNKAEELLEILFPTSKDEKSEAELQKVLSSLNATEQALIEKAGGIESLKEGLWVNDSGDTLFEKAARLDFFNEQFKATESSPEAGERADSDEKPEIGLEDIDVQIDVDSTENEDGQERSSSTPNVKSELDKEHIEAELEVIKIDISKKLAAGGDLSQELDKLYELSKTAYLAPSPDDDKKPKEDNPKSEDDRNQVMKTVLEIQVNALEDQIAISRGKIASENERLAKMKYDLSNKGGSDDVLVKEIADVESLLKSQESEIASFSNKLDIAKAQLINLN